MGPMADPVDAVETPPQGLSAGRIRSNANLKPQRKGDPSRNPSGRPALLKDVRDAARPYTPACMHRLAKLAGVTADGTLVKTDAPPSVQLGAVQALLDRAHGRPEQAVHVSGGEGVGLDVMAAAVLGKWLERARAEVAGQTVPGEGTVLALPETQKAPPR